MAGNGDLSGTGSITAARQIAATDPIGLLSAKAELPATGTQRIGPEHNRPASPATTATLGPGAQLLLSLLGQTDATAAPLQPATPLLPGLPTDTNSLAAALKAGIEHSGLFYESHLADWVAGQRNLSTLRAEPQGQMPSSVSTLASNQPDAGEVKDGIGKQHASAQNPSASMLAAIIHAQLDVIDRGRIHWQGEPWPGMQVDIQLTKEQTNETADPSHQQSSSNEQAQNQHAGGEAASQRDNKTEPGEGDDAENNNNPLKNHEQHRWHAKLVTRLPSLGQLSTRIILQGERIDLHIACDQQEMSQQLKAAVPGLATALQSAGLTLAGFVSQDHGHP